jgi:hypothetical protein
MASTHPAPRSKLEQQDTTFSLSSEPSLPAASDNSHSDQPTNAPIHPTLSPPSISSQDDETESYGSSSIEDDKRIDDRPSNEKLLVSFTLLLRFCFVAPVFSSSSHY